MITDLMNTLRPFLEKAGTSPADLDEIAALAERPPELTSIAVVGPQNAGKSTLIAVLTGSEAALADVAPTIATTTSHRYRYSRQQTSFELWDTPGLGTEFDEHDAEARDRVTKADAVLLAMSSDLVSEDGKAQLAELLQVGRKRGAVLPVVTKADREPLDNRRGIALAVDAILPELGREPLFVAAREVLDARADGDEPPAAAGIEVLQRELEALAVGEARRRLGLTAAVGLVELIERAESEVARDEPEAQRAHLFQRRVGRVLLRAQRRMQAVVEASERRSRLAALRATSEIGAALDERTSREALEVVAEESWQRFTEELERVESALADGIGEELQAAAQELRRLDQGELAEHLRNVAEGLDSAGPERPTDINPADAATAQRVLEFAGRAAGILSKVPHRRAGTAGAVMGIAVEVGAIVLDAKIDQEIEAAKLEIRREYLQRADERAELFRAWAEQTQGDTTQQALSRCAAIEDQLFASLSGLREALEHMAGARRMLDDHISAELRAGYEPEPS